jgi:hypothetical protein
MPELTLVVDEDDRLIRLGEQNLRLFLEGARSHMLPMAKGLLAARRKYPSNIAFKRWLAGSPYHELGKDDRAALIKIAENAADAEPVVSATGSTSPQAIWREVRAAQQSSSSTEEHATPPGNPFLERVKAKIRKIPPESLSDDIAQVARGVSDDAQEVVLELRRAIARMNDLLNTLTAYGEPGEEEDIDSRRLN